MEYTYKNNPTGKPITITLSDFSFSVASESNELHIPYASILSVRLKRSGNKFITIIKPSYHPVIRITSSCEGEDYTRQYHDFVKDLHAHLQGKSMAYYVCGNSLQQLMLISCFAVVMAFVISHSISDLGTYYTNLIAIGFSFLSITFIAIINWGHFPNVYKPDQIPPQFLPAAR